MNTIKQQYLQRIRYQSNYPTFKSVVGIVALLFYILAGVCAGAGFIGMKYGVTLGADEIGIMAFVLGLVLCLILAAIGIIVKGASLILADIGDSITDLNSRYEQESEEGSTSFYSSKKNILNRSWTQLIILLAVITVVVSLGWLFIKLF